MAVANLCFQKRSDEWTEDGNRKRQWRGKVSKRANTEVTGDEGEEEEEADGEEMEDTGSEEVREEVGEVDKNGDEGKKVKMEATVNEEAEDKGAMDTEESEVSDAEEGEGKKVGEWKTQSEEEGDEARENEAEIEVQVDRVEREEEQDGEEMEDDTGSEDVREEVSEAGRNGEEEEEDGGEGKKVKMEEIVSEEDTEEEEAKDKEVKRVMDSEEESEGSAAEEVEGKTEGGLKAKSEEEARENEAEIEVQVDKIKKEVRGSQEGPDKEQWEEEEEQTKEGEPVEDDENDDDHSTINQNGGAAQTDGTIREENLSDSAKSGHEDFDGRGPEGDSYDSRRENDEENQSDHPKETDDLRGNKDSTQEARTSTEVKEKEMSKRPTNEDETVTRSCSTYEEDFHDYPEEEEDSGDEEAEQSYEDVDCSDKDAEMKIYRQDNYPMDIFQTLTEFKDSFLLTDLIISTKDGMTFHVHSIVLAAVSSIIWETLNRGNMEMDEVDDMKDRETDSVEVNRWSLCLGPEVDHVGLEAVVEFAYFGHVSHLNKDTMEQIKAAAQTLGANRVVDLCSEEGSTQTEETKKERRMSAAEQRTISLQSIRQMWMDGVGCDVILDGIGESLYVHRIILGASSDYFRGMFTLGMRESHQPRVNLPFMLASELKTLIGCSYSGALPLSWRCVFELTSTALQLQYQPALSLCLSFLQKELNPQSCLDVASFAEAYEMSQLLEVADDYVLRQFQKVACTLKFKDLPARQLLKYLNSRSLCVPSELVVFKAVVAWIQAKPRTRLRLAKELMKTIHFPLMTFKEFKEVKSLNMWSEHSLVELYETIFEDFCSNETAPQSQYRTYLPKESLVLIGGDQISEDLGRRRISRELWFGNSLRNHTGIKKAMEWRRLGEMPEPARFSHEVAVVNGQLYVFGGKKYYGLGDTLNSVLRYDPNENSWESLPEMQEKRCFFSVVVLDGQIYAIGGHCDPEHRDSVERFCPATNSWSFTLPLSLPLSGHVAKVSQGQVFISGGLSDDHRCLATMFRYRPEMGSVYLADMTRPRVYHCMEALGDCLYVAGGNTVDEHMAAVDQLTCEVYSPAADTWTAFMSLPVPHVGAGSAVLEGKFYILGGYSQEDYSDTKMVHRYDPATQRWENMGKMPGPNNDIRASVLSLPQHLRS